MPEAQSRKPYTNPLLLWLIILLLTVACGVLAYVAFRPVSKDAATKTADINLGGMQYTFKDGKAVKRDDASVKGLQAFLNERAKHEGCSAEKVAYEHVVAYSHDESQVLLKYGCGSADSPIYAVKKDGHWQLLSPTNNFNYLGIPLCNYLTQNQISKDIAPVCVNDADPANPKTPPTYQVR